MKRIYKILTATMAALVLAVAPISVSANEYEPAVYESASIDSIDKTGTLGEAGGSYEGKTIFADSSDDGEAPGGTDSPEAADVNNTVTEGAPDSTEGNYTDGVEDDATDGAVVDAAGVSIFEDMFNAARAHASEILSALAFIASMVIAIGYKKGLVPLLHRAASKISESVDKTREGTEEEIKKRDEMLKEKEEGEVILSGKLTELSETISALSANLTSREALAECTEKIRIVILSQIDLLYDVFMSSALPQYQKELVGERVAKMKKELDSVEK